ncbi:hypothetical protein GOB57_09410 [Sinorhizobium meliloti]|nr:hypothetical protein [Sinorhizobium meliloti]
MKVTAKLPIHVRGTPVRNNGRRDIFVSRNSEWDIPEVSSSETELAFESFNAFISVVDEDDPLLRPIAHANVDSRVTAISYEGNLYRRVSRDGEDIPTLFSRAFPIGYDHESAEGVGSAISLQGFVYPGDEERKVRPVSLPVFRHLRWRMLCASTKDSAIQYQETWPQSIPGAASEQGIYPKRNHVTFEEVLPKIVEYDHDQLEACMRTHKGHMESFLVVDGQLWMRTRPPVYKVARHYGNRKRASSSVSLVFAPDWQDTKLSRAYFSLAARDEAFEHAHRLCDVLGGLKLIDWKHEEGAVVKHVSRVERGDVIDLTSNHVVHDPALVEYPYQEEELRRMSCGLAVETNRFITRNPSWREKFGTEAVNGVLSSYAEAMATNYLLGEYGDPSEHLESNATVWKKARRVHSTYEFGEVEVGDMLIERALRYDENKPIDLRAFHQPAPGRTF